MKNSPNESNLKSLSVRRCLTENKNCEIADFILVILVLWVTHRKKKGSVSFSLIHISFGKKIKVSFDTATNHSDLNEYYG